MCRMTADSPEYSCPLARLDKMKDCCNAEGHVGTNSTCHCMGDNYKFVANDRLDMPRYTSTKLSTYSTWQCSSLVM